MHIDFHVNYPLFLSDFLGAFSKNIQILNFMKIRPVIAELFHTDRGRDGQRVMMKLTVAFLNFGNAPKSDIDMLWYVSRVKD